MSAAQGIFALVAIISGVAAGFFTLERARGQEAGPPIELRTIAQAHDDSQVEFGVLHGEERLLPELRYLTPALMAQHVGTWPRSSEIDVLGRPQVDLGASDEADGTVETYTCCIESATTPLDRTCVSYSTDCTDTAWETPGFGLAEERVYVAAMTHTEGRIEFSLVHNGQRLTPEARCLTPELIETRAGDWLTSTLISTRPNSHRPA